MRQLSRRQTVALISSFIALTGFKSCKEKQSDLAALVEVLGHSIAQLIAVIGNSEVAAKLGQLTATAVRLLTMWVPGQDALQIVQTLNEMIHVILGVAGLDRFKPLVTFVLGTIAAIIIQLKGAPDTDIRIVQAPKDSREYKVDWDSIRAGGQGLEQAPIL